MSWTKPYTVDTGPSGDSKYTGFVKTGGNIDDLYTNANLLKNTHIGTTAATSPDTGQLWLDSNYTPPRLKQYNGTSWGLVAHAGFVPPRGFLINGKISATVASNNITVAIKTLADANPTTTDPVYCRIGDTVRTITAALSVTKAAGTNWFALGGQGAQDYFAYLGYNATDGVVIGFARIPYGETYADFSTSTTAANYCAISTITNAAATDVYVNIGRFDATLAAAAGYEWSIPSPQTVINRPIFETKIRTWVPTTTGLAVGATVACYYKISGRTMFVEVYADGTSDAATFRLTGPYSSPLRQVSTYFNGEDNGSAVATPCLAVSDGNGLIYLFSGATATEAWTTSGAKSTIYPFMLVIPI